jgi:hypothetical protein
MIITNPSLPVTPTLCFQGMGRYSCNYKCLDLSGLSIDLGVNFPQNVIRFALDLLISWVITMAVDFSNTESGFTNRMRRDFINE